MSNRVTLWVWDHSRAAGTDRYVLLAISRYTDDAGHEAWPSVATLAEKTGLGRRTVQRSIQALVELGELRVGRNAGGGARGSSDRRPNLYTVVMHKGAAVTPRGVPETTSRGATQAQPGRQPDTRTVKELSRRGSQPKPLARSIAELRERLDGCTDDE